MSHIRSVNSHSLQDCATAGEMAPCHSNIGHLFDCTAKPLSQLNKLLTDLFCSGKLYPFISASIQSFFLEIFTACEVLHPSDGI